MKKGFTLIELLAVIVILSIISLITVPIVNGIIESSKEKTFKNSVQSAFHAATYKIGIDDLNGLPPQEEYKIEDLDLSNYSLNGKFIFDEKQRLIAYFIKDENYCAYGYMTDLKIEKDCILLDSTPPLVVNDNIIITSTTKSIEINIQNNTAQDPESGIKNYKVNIYKEEKIIDSKIIETPQLITFNNLTSNTEYKVEIIISNQNNINNTITKQINTKVIDYPTYVIEPSEWSTSKTISINYPSGFINEYSIDEGNTWIKYDDSFTINNPTVIIARVNDGFNYISGNTQNISKIDNTIPEVEIISPVSNNTWTNNNITLSAKSTPETTPSGYTYAWYKDDALIDNSNASEYSVETDTTINSIYKVKVTTGANLNTTSNNYQAKIDKVSPKISLVPNGFTGIIPVEKESFNSTTNITITDAQSDILEKYYGYNTSNTQEPSYSPLTENSLKLVVVGEPHFLWIKAVDNAGNIAIKTAQYRGDYQIKYDVNGGVGNISDQYKKHNQDLTITSQTPTKANYVFKGWSTTSTGNVEYTSSSIFKINKPTILYAVWQIALTESTTTLDFNTSETQNRTLSKELEGYNSIVSITVDNGNVSYTMSGNTINVSVTNGTVNQQKSCENKYGCTPVYACHTSCWSCTESSSGTCCGCPGCWGGECCCQNEESCGYYESCEYHNYYTYKVTIKYMKGS